MLKKNELKSTEYKGDEYLSQTQSNGVNYLYFKLKLFDPTEFIVISGLQH